MWIWVSKGKGVAYERFLVNMNRYLRVEKIGGHAELCSETGGHIHINETIEEIAQKLSLSLIDTGGPK